jgi:Fe-S-cluster-containing dehydrogenase component
MSEYGLLIDYKYCSGCHTCEIACKKEKGLPTGQWGIKLAEIGPFEYGEDLYNWDYVPVPTNLCDMCIDRIEEGKKPSCVHHCLSFCMYYGKPDELEKIAEEKEHKVAVFLP